MVSTAATKSVPWGRASTAASSPMPRMTPDCAVLRPSRRREKAADQFELSEARVEFTGTGIDLTETRVLRTHRALHSGQVAAVLVRPQLSSGPVQDGIDELVAVGRAKLLGQLHRLGQRHR